MIPELGHFALCLALCLALVQGVLPLWGAARSDATLMAVARPAAQAQCMFTLVAYACLSWAFVANDFSVAYVAGHSNSMLPLPYRLAAVWGSHEGSLLLWVLILGLWTVAVTFFSRRLPEDMLARVLGVMGLVAAGFLLFLLATSNPFVRLLPAVPEGRDLNPLLQDPGMVFHPPLLYMGYVGFSVAFAFALAALLGGRLDAAWARWSRPWTTTAWLFLTLGIALGSGWAYYELGWGGWWFWDPVENASFMPWLVGTALIHSLAVTEKRGAFRHWTVLLAIAAFSLSLLGTFLVRSGVLTSVHAFATDPRRGVFILIFLALVVGGSLWLYAAKATDLGEGGRFSLVSRESLLLANNVLLAVAAASVLLGTIYPLVLDALGLGKISVGPPYFDTVFVPLMAPVVLLMAIGPYLRWKGDRVARIARTLGWVLGGSLAFALVLPQWAGEGSPLLVLGMFLALWLAASIAAHVARRRSLGSGGSLAYWGMMAAHLGVAVFIVGVSLVKSYESSSDVRLRIGETAELAGYRFQLDSLDEVDGPNYAAVRAQLSVMRAGRTVASLAPEKRIYRAQGMPMTEAAIDVGLTRDLYVALGEPLSREAWIVRLAHKPFVQWIWAGCLLMALGGASAAADRRYRQPASRGEKATEDNGLARAGVPG